MAHSPADTARKALHHLSELGLPPTPENFSRYYNEFRDKEEAAEKEKAAEAAISTETQELIRTVLAIVGTVTNTTAILASEISQHNRQMRSSIDGLAHAEEKKDVLTLLGSIVTTANSLHSMVEASHDELLETKQTLEQVRLEMRESREWMQLDPLTGTQNRRGMDEVLVREVARSRRNQTKLSVAMIDIDHFKRVNDDYGHHAGDKVLVHMAEVTKSVLRESDVLVRYGGEEFLLILPDTDLNGAKYVLDRLKIMIQKTPMVYEGKKIHITISCGLAQLSGDENGHALVMRADKALYEAKRAGRDCIMISAA